MTSRSIPSKNVHRELPYILLCGNKNIVQSAFNEEKINVCSCWSNTKIDTAEKLYNIFNCRNSRPEVFCKKGVLKNFAKLTGKHLCQSLFFNKVAGPRVKRDSGAGVFLWKFWNFKILENLFYRTPPGNYFCNWKKFTFKIYYFER